MIYSNIKIHIIFMKKRLDIFYFKTKYKNNFVIFEI